MKSCSKCLPTLLTTVNFTGRNWISKTAYWNIWHKDKRKIQKASIRFLIFVKNYFSFQFHVNLEYYVLGSPIRVNFIDFNCYCHWFKTAIVGKQVALHPPPPPLPLPLLFQTSARRWIHHVCSTSFQCGRGIHVVCLQNTCYIFQITGCTNKLLIKRFWKKLSTS